MPHIQNDNNLLKITMNKKSLIERRGEPIYKTRVNLVNINIDQSVYLMTNGSVLTYEDASLATGYIYSYGMKRTVGILFPEYNYDLVDTKGNIYFFKLSRKDTTLYLILENINKRRIKMIYGLSQNASGIDNNKSTYIKSRWNAKNILLDNIITKRTTRVRVKR